MKKLLLFDIDGTMLQTGGAGRRAVERAVSERLNRPVDSSSLRYSGKTDPQILREVLLMEGMDEAGIFAALPDLLKRYEEIMFEALRPEHVTLLPGVRELIENLHEEPTVQLAVLTGNLESMARLKLEAVGMSGYFPFGAFGSDSPHRNDLPSIAIRRAREYTGRTFAGKNVIVIGDTEHDIHCGVSAGALCVGVCTGHYSREDLALHAPDVILDDLSDYNLFRAYVLHTLDPLQV
jgi:phosphoglycolate phosphatase